MKAIILAAGRGSRMKNLTDEKPKCLVKVEGRTLLEWQLDAIRAAGIDEIGIVTGYKRELLAEFGLTEFHNDRWQTTNMVTSLSCATEWLEGSTCIVSYSDIFYKAEAVLSLKYCRADIAVTYDKNWLDLWQRRFGNPLLDAETFRIDEKNHLIEIGNKPETLNQIQGQYMGILRFTPAGWCAVTKIREAMSPEQQDSMHMTGTLQKIIEKNAVPIQAIPYEIQWGEVDSAEDLAIYN